MSSNHGWLLSGSSSSIGGDFSNDVAGCWIRRGTPMNETRVLIVGAGEHAQVVADALLRAREANVTAARPVGFLDDEAQLAGHEILGLPVIGPLSCLSEVEHDAVVVAIGSNRTRQRLAAALRQAGEVLFTVRHPSAIIAPSAEVGAGVMISAGVIVNTGSVVGDNVILNTGCTVDHHNRIGSHAHIAPGAHLGGDVRIGEGTLIGIGAIVLPQRRVGAWCTVGGGAVVTRDLADERTAVGVPAKIIER